MRLFLGIILGCAITVAAAYVADATSSSAAAGKPMVNWDVVAKNVHDVSALARDAWRKITG